MEKIIVNFEFAKVVLTVSIIAIVVTIIIDLIFRNIRIIKYIPGFILVMLGLYNLFYLGKEFSTDRMFVIVIEMVAGFIGISTGLIIGIIRK